MMARLIHHEKQERGDGSIIELVIWEIPPSTERPHGFKYRFHYGSKDGVCYIRYDNELKKGDHKHIGTREEKYQFMSIEKLIADFENDIDAYRKGQIK